MNFTCKTTIEAEKRGHISRSYKETLGKLSPYSISCLPFSMQKRCNWNTCTILWVKLVVCCCGNCPLWYHFWSLVLVILHRKCPPVLGYYQEVYAWDVKYMQELVLFPIWETCIFLVFVWLRCLTPAVASHVLLITVLQTFESVEQDPEAGCLVPISAP